LPPIFRFIPSHEVEEALATLGLDALADGAEADVVVGGLGLGYTALAALHHPSLRSLVVVDTLDAVIDWRRQGLPATHGGSPMPIRPRRFFRTRGGFCRIF